MLQFEAISKRHYKEASEIMKKAGFGSAESSFVPLYMWGEAYNTQICIDGGSVFVRAESGGERYFLFPCGGNTKAALAKIFEFCEENGEEPLFYAVTDKMREMMEAAFPDKFEFSETRDLFDYVYNARALETLEGSKLHKKRNHLNKFLKLYDGRFVYESISEGNINEVAEFQKKWAAVAAVGDRAEILKKETVAISRALDAFFEMNLLGGVIRIDGEIRAYCLGSEIGGDTVDVTTEKGDYEYEGIYQAINKFFVERSCKNVGFVNREDDAGSEGLRKAKLSYYPALLLRKYCAKLK